MDFTDHLDAGHLAPTPLPLIVTDGVPIDQVCALAEQSAGVAAKNFF